MAHNAEPTDVLLRDEAQGRARLLSKVSYRIALDLTQGDEVFGSDTTVAFACAEPGARTFLELLADEVSSIELNGRAIDPGIAFVDGRIVLDGLEGDNTVRVVATCRYSRSGTGLHFFRDPVDGNPYLYTQMEAYEAHKVFAGFDQPDLKATFDLSVTAPAGWTVVSNTEPTERPADGAAGRWVFAPTKVMSTYLLAIIAGPYHVVRDTHGDVQLGIYCRASLAQYLDAEEIFEVTKRGLDFFEALYDFPYMWGKYDHVFAPEFNAGAMENPGAVTVNERGIFRSKATEDRRRRRAVTMLHEMAHMWFGDLVTMDWWDDLWLNESFASYMGILATARATRWTDAMDLLTQGSKPSAIALDQMATTHPIVAEVLDTDAARVNFDAISYSKGASVLRQLVACVGEQAFTEGIRVYFRRYQYGNADLAKFLAAVEETAGRDLSAWSKEWLETAGVNVFRARVETDGEVYRSVTLEQTAAVAGQPTLRSHRIGVGLYDLRDGTLARRRSIEVDAAGPATVISELAGERVADLLLVNDGDLTYCKIRFDERSAATVVDHLAKLDDPLARALCWTAAADQVRDGEMAARDFVRLVLANIHVETEPGAVEAHVTRAQDMIALYADAAGRDALRLGLARRALDELRAAEPGSDLQLIWAQTLVANARTGEHLALVRGLLDGTTVFSGLPVEADLRWAVVAALSATGTIGEPEIAAELERDPTEAGARQAAAARALQPTATAKADAWRAILDGDESFQMRQARFVGFQRGEQAGILRAYVEPYFERLRPMWDVEPTVVTKAFCTGLYPTVDASADLAERTAAYLRQHPDLPSPLRRYLREAQENAERAVRARAVDAAASRRAGGR